MKNNFCYYNPNPSQRYKKDGSPMNWTKGDCAVRALCAATGNSWEDMFRIMCQTAMEMYDMPNSDKVIDTVLDSFGFIKEGFKRNEVKPTINDFCKSHSKGIYILRMSGHIVTVKNGKINDTWDCGEWKVRSYHKK